MKLTSQDIETTLTQFAARPVPDNHPVMNQFNTLFGDHTFFIDQNGLNIVESEGPGEAGSEFGRVIKLASWSDENRSKLTPHARQPTDILVQLSKAA
jgi:hypothetical protein